MAAQALLEQTIARIKPLSPSWRAKAWRRWDALAKPRRSLGELEEIGARVAAILRQERPQLKRKRIFVFAGDHQVTAEGVSAYPAAVTALMVKNFLAGGAAINVLARQARAQIEVIDIGMAEDLGALPGLQRYNVKRGADNIARGPAMTISQARQAIGVGLTRAARAAQGQVTLLGTGEMGIGNTTPAAALFSFFLKLPAEETVGAGSGLNASGVRHKVAVVKRALAHNRARCTSALGTLAALGGLEIAGICGLCLGAAAHSRPVVVDGFIASAGALAALRLCPTIKDYLFFAHLSPEGGHRQFFEQEGLRPLLKLGLRLGEGTGTALGMQIIVNAVALYNEMATFAATRIRPGA